MSRAKISSDPVDTNNPILPAGGGQAHNNLQPYIVTKFIIKAFDDGLLLANIANSYSTSATDAYSASYVNSIIPTVNNATLTIQKMVLMSRPLRLTKAQTPQRI